MSEQEILTYPWRDYNERRTNRDEYEIRLVQVLQSLGYPIELSTDSEDVIFGIDAWDTEYQIPWDIYISTLTNMQRYQNKLSKTVNARVQLLPLRTSDFEAVWGEDKEEAAEKLSSWYSKQRELSKDKQFITREEVEEKMPQRRKDHKKNRGRGFNFS